MIFNKKFLNAIEAVLDISIYSSHSPTRADEITKRQGIPSRYLENILSQAKATHETRLELAERWGDDIVHVND